MFIKTTQFFQSISFLLLFTLTTFGQDSGGSSSSGGQGKVWDQKFPYPSDFPPLEDPRVELSNAADAIGNNVFTAQFFLNGKNGQFLLVYDYQDATKGSSIYRKEVRTELTRPVAPIP